MPLSKRALTLLCLLWAPLASMAVKPQNVSPGEIALLPPYCPHTEAFDHGPKNSPTQSPEAPYWESLLGPTFWAMHHYCWGLVNLNRLQLGRAATNNKQSFAKGIVDEYAYVIRHSAPDFILLPELWLRVGEASLLAGNIGQAMEAYASARRIKPDYWPAYTQWAEFLLSYGRKAEAKALLEDGLRLAPDAPELTDLYRRVDRSFTATTKPVPSDRPPPADAAPTAEPAKPDSPTR